MKPTPPSARSAPASPAKSRTGGESPNKVPLIAFADIKSSLGEQVDSRKVTAPVAVFGSSTRPRTTSGANSPGPGTYQLPTSIGKPVLSTIITAPACSISGREKFGSTMDSKETAKTPGPGNYSPQIVNPREREAPHFSLGKKWTKGPDYKRTPGPGTYESPTTIGRSVLSTIKSNPMPAFTRVERKPLLKTCTADVGPGQYGIVVGAVGKQPISTLSSASSYSFGTAKRSKTDNGAFGDGVPGPNSYSVKSSVGYQVESTYRSAPMCSMSGRTKFGSHF